MDCKTVSSLIEDFRDSALDKATKRQVVDHLGECEDCRRLLTRLDKLDGELRAALNAPKTPPGLTARIAAAIQNENISARTAPTPAFWIKQAAMLAACLLAILAFWRIRSEPDSPEGRPAVSQNAVPKEPPFFEPGPEDRGIGKPFVVTSDGKTPYAGKPGIIISKIVNGTPQLTVEAFVD
jgi:hypothetical protein